MESWDSAENLERLVLSALEAIKASDQFRNSPRAFSFLNYVVGEDLAGRTEMIKETTIGMEVFHLQPDTNYKENSIVRKTAHVVRRRLLRFNAWRGSDLPVRITLPPNSYKPQIDFIEPNAAAPAGSAIARTHIGVLQPSTFPDCARLKPLAQQLHLDLVDRLRKLPESVVETVRAGSRNIGAFEFLLEPFLLQQSPRGELALMVAVSSAAGEHIATERVSRPEHLSAHLVADIGMMLHATLTGARALNAGSPAEQARLTRDFLDWVEATAFLETRTPDGIMIAIDRFDRIMERRPNDSAALAGSAEASLIVHHYRAVPAALCWERALMLAGMAVREGPKSSEGYTALAYATVLSLRQPDLGLRHFEKAITLNPNNHRARHWHSNVLSMLGRTEGAVREMEAALTLRPTDPIVVKSQGDPWLYAHDFDRAEKLYSAALEKNNHWMAHLFRAQALILRARPGDHQQAATDLELAATLNPASAHLAEASLGYLHARRGDASLSNAILNRLLAAGRPGIAHSIAVVYAGFGDADNCIAWLRRALEDPSEMLYWVGVDPRFEVFHGHSEFTAVLAALGLCSYCGNGG